MKESAKIQIVSQSLLNPNQYLQLKSIVNSITHLT